MQKSRQSVMDVIFTLALFCTFFATAIGVVIIGVGVYKNTVVAMQSNFGTGTAIAYVTEKARQADTAGGVEIRTVENETAIVFKSETEGIEFETTIFFKDGYIRELIALAGADIPLSAAQPIVALKSFEVEKLEDNLYKIEVTGTDDAKEQAIFALTSTC
ncbi:MAG: DUF4860 domain-containing protein [Oscillospiraceae bacterium]